MLLDNIRIIFWIRRRDPAIPTLPQRAFAVRMLRGTLFERFNKNIKLAWIWACVCDNSYRFSWFWWLICFQKLGPRKSSGTSGSLLRTSLSAPESVSPKESDNAPWGIDMLRTAWDSFMLDWFLTISSRVYFGIVDGYRRLEKLVLNNLTWTLTDAWNQLSCTWIVLAFMLGI